MENEKKIIIDDLVSEILKDYQDDKVINQQAIFSQPDKDSVNDLLQKLIKKHLLNMDLVRYIVNHLNLFKWL